MVLNTELAEGVYVEEHDDPSAVSPEVTEFAASTPFLPRSLGYSGPHTGQMRQASHRIAHERLLEPFVLVHCSPAQTDVRDVRYPVRRSFDTFGKLPKK